MLHRLDRHDVDRVWPDLLDWNQRILREPVAARALEASLADSTSVAMKLYGPLLLGAHAARARGASFVTAHLAQTLDGRIACENGQSRWIGNEANLHHAHRLRALHDAVLVGRRTVEIDNPRLTVRHVAGPNPRRVILSAEGAHALKSTVGLHVYDAPGSLLLSGNHADLSPSASVEVQHVARNGMGLFHPDEINRALRSRGLHSVFLEGGGRTLSTFLEYDAIDVLHLHFAPIVLGSGQASIMLPKVTSIGEGRRFATEIFELEGEILYVCKNR